MSEPFRRLRRFLRELKRRNVYKVAVAYLAVAFVGIQAAQLLVPPTTLPAWADDLLIYLAVFGFPIALVIAWAFEMTPEGMRRTREAERAEEGATGPGQGLSTGYKALVGLGVLAAAVAGGWYLTGSGGEPEVTDRSIAVLPFENMGGEESEQFTEGVHDGLLTRLSNVVDLQVISRTSVMQYEETDKTVPQIARELGVTWVVEGAVQHAGGQIQVNAQLIKAPEDAHRWAQRYQRQLNPDNLFAIQSELTKKIATSLKAKLTSDERRRIERRPTEDLEAYRLYSKGRTLLEQRTDSTLRRAEELFRRALERDSTYAMAWAGLADALTFQAGAYGDAAPDSVLPPAIEAARRALQLDASLAEAHTALGRIHHYRANGPAALRELQRAVELSGSYAPAYETLGMHLLMIGRPEGALDAIEQSVALDPLAPENRVALAYAHLALGNYERALRAARRAHGIQPELGSGVIWKALHHLGRLTEADTIGGRKPVLLLALSEATAGEPTRARDLLDRLEGRKDRPLLAVGMLHAALGHRNEAFAAFKKHIQRFRRTRGWEVVSPGMSIDFRYYYPKILGPIRDDSRYREILRDLNRFWRLNPDGSLPDSVEASFRSASDI